MKFRHIIKVLFTIFFLYFFTCSVWSQDSVKTAMQKKSPPPKLMFQFSDKDIILPISSIEWGTPDRWSITSRYIHMFENDRDGKIWLDALSISLSPGISGGRFAVGYGGVLLPSYMDFAFLSDVRVVLLRTWGNPLYTVTNHTFFGAEIRSSFSGIINFGIGYFKQISVSNGRKENFYGLHIGIGV